VNWVHRKHSASKLLSEIGMPQAEPTVEESPDTSVKARPTVAPRKTNPWHLPIRLLISFVEALGRSSEEFYVYLPLALEPTLGSTEEIQPSSGK